MLYDDHLEPFLGDFWVYKVVKLVLFAGPFPGFNTHHFSRHFRVFFGDFRTFSIDFSLMKPLKLLDYWLHLFQVKWWLISTHLDSKKQHTKTANINTLRQLISTHSNTRWSLLTSIIAIFGIFPWYSTKFFELKNQFNCFYTTNFTFRF